ncbi:MAG: hypothetical protein Q8P80_01280 [Candidatus Levybacteria bacterium]|nr:hypothetical protein [Candidatus Levybacteria bacterium]
MKKPTQKQMGKIDKFPSTWSDVDFSKLSDSEKLYWLEQRRIIPWLLGDTKRIKEVAGSMFGLAAMVCVGVEFLSKFRYANDQSNLYFPLFLEEYIDVRFKKEIKQPYAKVSSGDRDKWFYNKQKVKYSEIFYFGIRNQLLHKFLLRHTVLIEPLPTFLKWERGKKRLLVDTRVLLVVFENGVYKYLQQLWKAKSNSDIYKNFFVMFTENFEKKY